MIKYSIVIPIYNEEGSLVLLFDSIKNIMDQLSPDWEAIFINDHSKDRGLQTLKNIDAQGGHLVIIDLKKRYGKSASLQAGFDNARGEIIITLDGDLQNDPKDIPKLLEKMQEGFDVVCGWRHQRNDPWLKILSANIAGAVRKIITREDIHDVGCAFRVFKKETVKNVYLSKGLHRFLTLIMFKRGYKTGEVKIRHHPRRFGKSKYNIRNRLFEGMANLIDMAMFDARRPMKRKPTYEIRKITSK
jgi:glycosyltransferase involved in cell wall biosynthesis